MRNHRSRIEKFLNKFHIDASVANTTATAIWNDMNFVNINMEAKQKTKKQFE